MKLYNLFLNIAKKFPSKRAVNDCSFNDLLNLIHNNEYKLISSAVDENIIIDILHASYRNLPLIIPPKYDSDNILIPDDLNNVFELYLYSSGSTGTIRKAIKIPEDMILKNSEIAINSQKLSVDDNIFTVCSLNHTGGINAQTLPALLAGSSVIIKKFNGFSFFKDVKNYNITKTHLVPAMIDTLIKLNNFQSNMLKLVVAGSDCIKKEHVDFFLQNGVNFMCNYGLTEAGPIIINHIFSERTELEIFNQGIPLGDKCWCDFTILNSELILKGKNVHKDGWLHTGDCVHKINDWIFYNGRKTHGCKIIPKKYRM